MSRRTKPSFHLFVLRSDLCEKRKSVLTNAHQLVSSICRPIPAVPINTTKSTGNEMFFIESLTYVITEYMFEPVWLSFISLNLVVTVFVIHFVCWFSIPHGWSRFVVKLRPLTLVVTYRCCDVVTGTRTFLCKLNGYTNWIDLSPCSIVCYMLCCGSVSVVTTRLNELLCDSGHVYLFPPTCEL